MLRRISAISREAHMRASHFRTLPVVVLCVPVVILGAGALSGCSKAASADAAAGGHAHYAPAGPDQPNKDGQVAPRLQNLGAHTFPVSTKNDQAQRFINQGMNLSFAFNHAE